MTRSSQHTSSGRRTEWSAGGVVLRYRDGEAHVLLIRDPYRKWGLPKGHIEGGEGPQEAALREVREETGLDQLILGPEVGSIDWYFQQRGVRIHKYCRFYLMAAPQGEPVPEEAEGITECRWLPLPQAIGRIAYDNAREILNEASRMIRLREGDELPWVDANSPGTD